MGIPESAAYNPDAWWSATQPECIASLLTCPLGLAFLSTGRGKATLRLIIEIKSWHIARISAKDLKFSNWKCVVTQIKMTMNCKYKHKDKCSPATHHTWCKESKHCVLLCMIFSRIKLTNNSYLFSCWINSTTGQRRAKMIRGMQIILCERHKIQEKKNSREKPSSDHCI